jgi:hypothetical protein
MDLIEFICAISIIFLIFVLVYTIKNLDKEDM